MYTFKLYGKVYEYSAQDGSLTQDGLFIGFFESKEHAEEFAHYKAWRQYHVERTNMERLMLEYSN